MGHILGRDLDRGGGCVFGKGKADAGGAYGLLQTRDGDGHGAALFGGQGGVGLAARHGDGLGGQIDGIRFVAAAQEMEGMEVADEQLSQKGQDEQSHRHPFGGVLAGEQDEGCRQKHKANEIRDHTDQGITSF